MPFKMLILEYEILYICVIVSIVLYRYYCIEKEQKEKEQKEKEQKEKEQKEKEQKEKELEKEKDKEQNDKEQKQKEKEKNIRIIQQYYINEKINNNRIDNINRMMTYIINTNNDIMSKTNILLESQ
jgi:tRNA C32,U32 (ribose-2'-O)-methylase TrmJ